MIPVSALAPTRSRSQTQSNIWTLEEDVHLGELMSNFPPPSWGALSHNFPGKTTQQIAGRWEKVLNPNLVKGSWTREEDEAIVAFVSRTGPRNWVKLAEMLPGRIGKQCRERWTNHLSPEVARSGWTAAEDARLVDLFRNYGNRWTLIAAYMDGRTDNDVKNRWNSSLKRRIDRISKGEPEFKKRGRKPKLVKTQSSECESPDVVPRDGSTEICVLPGKPMIPLAPTDDAQSNAGEGGRLNLDILLRNQIF
jgi:hypothetical protein